MKKKIKIVQVKAIYVCLKGENIQKNMFYWNVNIKSKLQENKKTPPPPPNVYIYSTYCKLLSEKGIVNSF